MAIQIPNPGTGNGATGDNEFVLWSKVKDNFNDQTNAASRLVGTANGQVPLAEQIPSLLGTAATRNVGTAMGDMTVIGFSGVGGLTAPMYSQRLGGLSYFLEPPQDSAANTPGFQMALTMLWGGENNAAQILAGLSDAPKLGFRNWVDSTQKWGEYREIYHTGNVTKDANGFLKGASPVVDLYDEKIELNYDAKAQGGITFERISVGDYLVKGSLGFSQEGWYIETPKDANGNVLVAVVYEQLENNDISIKTYAKKFDDETGDIVPNLLKPRDIPAGRFISLRLHELPKEPQPEV